MSPLNKKKLEKLRSKLDKLDNDFLKLIKKRSNIVNDVLKLKIYKKEIIDHKRIKYILKKICFMFALRVLCCTYYILCFTFYFLMARRRPVRKRRNIPRINI